MSSDANRLVGKSIYEGPTHHISAEIQNPCKHDSWLINSSVLELKIRTLQCIHSLEATKKEQKYLKLIWLVIIKLAKFCQALDLGVDFTFA